MKPSRGFVTRENPSPYYSPRAVSHVPLGSWISAFLKHIGNATTDPWGGPTTPGRASPDLRLLPPGLTWWRCASPSVAKCSAPTCPYLSLFPSLELCAMVLGQ